MALISNLIADGLEKDLNEELTAVEQAKDSALRALLRTSCISPSVVLPQLLFSSLLLSITHFFRFFSQLLRIEGMMAKD